VTLRLDQLIRTSHRKAEARSPQQQRDIARACAQTHGYTIGVVHDSGRSESGKTMDRASVHAAMARVRAGLTDGVIVALTDRVGRAPIEEAMGFMRELHVIGGVFVPADAGGRPIDLSEPMAETNLVLQLQMARQFWLTKAQGFQRSQRDAIRAGKWIGPAPIGYVSTGGYLHEHEHYGPTIRAAYRLAAHDGLHAAVKYLRETAPERNWTTSETRRVLSKRVYLAEIHHGAHAPNLDAPHPALTTLDLFLAAQTEPQHRLSNGDYVLSKLATCETCGEGLTGQLSSAGGRRERRYRCSNVKSCGGGTSISADALEAHVRGVFAAFLDQWEFRVRFEVEGLQEAQDALTQARDDARRFARNARLLSAMSDEDAAAMAEGLAAEVDAALTRYEGVAKLATRSEQMPSADQLKDDDGLLRALRLIEPRIVVKRGRRGGNVRTYASVAERVSITDEDGLDYGAGVLAA
jgi:DNA invertase Pin-like site-specific DNA recombinase